MSRLPTETPLLRGLDAVLPHLETAEREDLRVALSALRLRRIDSATFNEAFHRLETLRGEGVPLTLLQYLLRHRCVRSEDVQGIAADGGRPPDPRDLPADLDLVFYEARRELRVVPIEIPRTIGGYHVLERIGRGGMGVVLRVVDRAGERVAALKFVPIRTFGDANTLARFRREIRVLRDLDHPGIVRFQDDGADEVYAWFVMEYVPGLVLSRAIDRGEVTIRRAIDIAIGMAEALEYAHARGVIHRDLKPANVMLESDGPPRVLDFGLAKSLGAATVITRAGAFVGTPTYAAPEIFEPRLGEAGPAADVYSLGVLLYEMATLEVPFAGTDFGRIRQRVLCESPTPLRRLQPAIPAALEAIVDRCLQKRPDRRYEDGMAGLRSALERCRANLSTRTHASSCDEPARTTRLSTTASPDPPEPSGERGSDPVRESSTPRYEVVGELGRGGMGQVLLVLDREIGREVAKKRVLVGSESEAGERRFLREAQVTGQLEHPNIIPVYDMGNDPDGARFYTMKRIHGETLAELLRSDRHAPPLSRLLEIFLKVCDAISYAHSKGILHRDLKPANILVGGFGEVLVLDWGLARPVGATGDPEGSSPAPALATRLTMTGALMGTPSYMSPEQADSSRLDERSDIFALGAILYEILVRRPAFIGGSVQEVLARVLTARPVRPREVAVGRRIAPELEAICLKALEKAREERYATVSDLALDLRRYVEGHSVSALPDGALRRARKWAARHPSWTSAAVATVILLGLAGGAIGAILLDREGERTRALEERTRLIEERSAADAEVARTATARVEAHGAYLKAAPLLVRRLPEEAYGHLIASLEEVVRRDPTFVDAQIGLGQAHLGAEDHEGALRAFLEADRQCRRAQEASGQGVAGSPRALHLAGLVTERRARLGPLPEGWPSAETFFRRAVELDPTDPYARASLQYVEPDLGEARRLVEDHPNLAEAYAAYGWAANRETDLVGRRVGLADDEFERVDRLLSQGIDLLRPDALTASSLIELRWQRGLLRCPRPGREAEGLADLEEAERILGSTPDPEVAGRLALHIAEALLGMGRVDEALQAVERAGTALESHPAIPRLRGMCFLSRGDRSAEALLHLQEASRRSGEAGDASVVRDLNVFLVMAAMEAGRPDVAMAVCDAWEAPLEFTATFFTLDRPEERLVAAFAGLTRHLRRVRPAAERLPELDRQLRLWSKAGLIQAEAALAAGEADRTISASTYALLALDGLEEADLVSKLNALGMRAITYSRTKRYGEAIPDLEASLGAIGDPPREGLRARAAADTFQLAACRAYVGTERALSPDARRTVLDLLERATALGFGRADLLEQAEAFRPLRADPEFGAILDRMRR